MKGDLNWNEFLGKDVAHATHSNQLEFQFFFQVILEKKV
jgi:hypothetical protein